MRLAPTSLLDFINRENVFETPFIDWLNITSRRPDKLKTHEERLHELYSLINVFEGVSFVDVSAAKTQLNFDSIDGTIRIVINAQFVQVQLRGSYWILHFGSAFDYALDVYKKLQESSHYKLNGSYSLIAQEQNPELMNNYTITRLDVRRDMLHGIKSILPVISEEMRPILDPEANEDYSFGFQASFVPFVNKMGRITGFKTKSADWTITVYDKKAENDLQKNKIKQSAYSLLYAGTDKPITRIELRLDGTAINNYATVLFRKMILGEAYTQKEFCDLNLKKFYDKRRCYLKTGKHRKNEEDEPRWKNFFNSRNEAFNRSRVEKIDFKVEDELEQAKRYFITAFKKSFVYSKERSVINRVIDECAAKALKEVEEFEKGLKEGAGATAERTDSVSVRVATEEPPANRP